jgi:hypothetical protein
VRLAGLAIVLWCFEAHGASSVRHLVSCGSLGRMHQRVLQLLDEQRPFALSRAVLDSAHVRSKGGGELAGPRSADRSEPGSEMRVLPDVAGLPLRAGLSVANTHDSQILSGSRCCPISIWDTNPMQSVPSPCACMPQGV